MQAQPTHTELLAEIQAIRTAAHALGGRLEQHIFMLVSDEYRTRSQFALRAEFQELKDSHLAAHAELRKALAAMSAIAAR